MKGAKGDLVAEEKGALFEGLVAQLLRAYKDYCDIYNDIFYWAPAGQPRSEVDFLLRKGSDLIAIEAKSGNTFTDAWCKGLRSVSKLKGLQRRIVVYPRGPVLRTEDGIDVFPLQHFADLLSGKEIFR
jgi:predicted AAA+ superfamily ATPase